MKKKYRLLKPNETIREGDWCNASLTESPDRIGNKPEDQGGWIRTSLIGDKVNTIPSLIFARYVGPVCPHCNHVLK